MLLLLSSLVLCVFHRSMKRRCEQMHAFSNDLLAALDDKDVATSPQAANVKSDGVGQCLDQARRICRRLGLERREELLLLWQEVEEAVAVERLRWQLLSLYLQRMLSIVCVVLLMKVLFLGVRGFFVQGFFPSLLDGTLEAVGGWFLLLGYATLYLMLYHRLCLDLTNPEAQACLIEAVLLDQYPADNRFHYIDLMRCRAMKRSDVRQGVDGRSNRVHLLVYALKRGRVLCQRMRMAESLLPVLDMMAGGAMLAGVLIQMPTFG